MKKYICKLCKKEFPLKKMLKIIGSTEYGWTDIYFFGVCKECSESLSIVVRKKKVNFTDWYFLYHSIGEIKHRLR